MPNISSDYIAAVKSHNNVLECIQIPLQKPIALIGELKAMLENPNRTVYDLQCKFSNDYKFEAKAWYICYPYSYSSSYLSFIRPPKIKTYSELKENWNKEYNDFVSSYKSRCESDDVYYNEDEGKRLAKEHVDKLKKNEKNAFYNECVKWIDANEIQTTTSSISNRNDILMYSKEDIGWSNFNYNISNDLKISIATNFGYGSAAYFFLSVRYKDVDIIPYSFIVKYYKAYMADIIRCTRSYDASRGSWEAAFDFVVDIANQAHSNPEDFIKEYVMNEVQEMMTGLKSILDNPQNVQNRLVGVKVPELLVNVRNVWDNERNRMRAYPQESLFMFKVEKITGALHFLNSLRNVASAFVEIEKDINKHIETLLSYNFEIYPKVRVQYEEIEKRIAKEQYELSIKESKRDSVVCSLKSYEEELEDLCKEITSWFERNEKEDIYKKSNPEYVRLLNEKQDLNAKISEHRNHINEYSNFNTMLQEAMKLIDSVREVA